MFARNKIGPMVRSVWGSTFVDWAVSEAEYPWRISMYASMSRLNRSLHGSIIIREHPCPDWIGF